jgi:hypothetical protein
MAEGKARALEEPAEPTKIAAARKPSLTKKSKPTREVDK